MYNIVIMPDSEIGFDLLIVDEYNKQILYSGLSTEYNIFRLIENIKKILEEYERNIKK